MLSIKEIKTNNHKVTIVAIYIIESVDSISRDGPDCPYM